MSYDRNSLPTLSPSPRLRLLPWKSDTGKPCFLSTNGTPGALARIADRIEADQLRDGAVVLKGARAVLADCKAGEYAVRLALRAVTQCLGDVLRIADSRGARLPRQDDDHEPYATWAEVTEVRQDPTEVKETAMNVRIELHDQPGEGDGDGHPGQPWQPPQDPPSPDGSGPEGDGKHRK
jgi:hypothetical protein